MAAQNAWVYPQRKNQTSSFGDGPESGAVRELVEEQKVQDDTPTVNDIDKEKDGG